MHSDITVLPNNQRTRSRHRAHTQVFSLGTSLLSIVLSLTRKRTVFSAYNTAKEKNRGASGDSTVAQRAAITPNEFEMKIFSFSQPAGYA